MKDEGEPNFRLRVPVYRLPSTVYRLPSTVYRLPSTVYRLPSTVYRLPSTCALKRAASSPTPESSVAGAYRGSMPRTE
jgi:hypothetical protein